MPEPTMREIERLILKLGTQIAEVKGDVAECRAEVAKNAAQCSGIALINARLDELTQSCDHTTELVAALNQITTGVRSLGESSYDMVRTTARRLSGLVNALVHSGTISYEALREELGADAPGDETAASVATQHD